MKRERRIILFFVFALTCITVSARNVVYDKSDSILVENLLTKATSMPVSTNYPLFFARALKGVKYVAHVLEQTKTEQLIVNLRQLDCTTFVESVMALTICAKKGKRSFEDYCIILRTLRYRNGIITDYSSRLHYFTDWIVDNERMGFVRRIQTPEHIFSCTKASTYKCMTDLWKNYRQLVADKTLIPKIAVCEDRLRGMKFRYIPASRLKENRRQLSCIHDGDILCMVASADYLDVTHLGIAVWHGDVLHMIDASQIQGKVIEEAKSMHEYIKGKKSQKGILVVRQCVSDIRTKK